jgi:outer membrane protein assembly factor BamA
MLLALAMPKAILWSQATDTSAQRIKKLMVPLAGYSPETGFGVGASGLAQFKIQPSDTVSPYSTAQITAGITINGQWLLALPFDLYFQQRKHQITGECSAQKSKLRFYGIGHLPELQGNERFESSIFRARVQYLKKVDAHLYIGGRWWYEQYSYDEQQADGLLASGRILGGENHRVSGPGLQIVVDNRDQIYYPQRGHFLEISMHDQRKHWGSDYSYLRYRLDARKFIPIQRTHVVGMMVFGDFIRGQAPYTQLPAIGSLKRMRGFYEGRFRDHQLILLQLEERWKFHRLLALHFFGSAAYMNNFNFSLKTPGFHTAYGLGLRYFWNPKSRTTIRFDAAFGSDKPLFYLSVGEAF